jgi:hypothetical protein
MRPVVACHLSPSRCCALSAALLRLPAHAPCPAVTAMWARGLLAEVRYTRFILRTTMTIATYAGSSGSRCGTFVPLNFYRTAISDVSADGLSSWHAWELSALRICWRQAGAGAQFGRHWAPPPDPSTKGREHVHGDLLLPGARDNETGLIGSFCGRDILRRQ